MLAPSIYSILVFILLRKRKRALKRKKDKSGLKFKTMQEAEKNRKKRILIIFIVIALSISVASVYVMKKEKGGDEKKKTETPSAERNIEKEVNILVGGSSSKGKLIFLEQVTLNTKDDTVTVKPVLLQSQCSDGTSLAEVYDEGDGSDVFADRLMDEAGRIQKVKFDRYVILQETSISRFVHQLGRYEIHLKENISFSENGNSISWVKGTRELSGEDFFTYMAYLGRSGTTASQYRQAEELADFIRQEFRPDTVSRGQELFETLANLADNNISVQDYAKYSEYLDELSKKKLNIKVTEE